MFGRRRTEAIPPPPSTDAVLHEIEVRLAEVRLLSRRLASVAAAKEAEVQGAVREAGDDAGST
jgi:hypothetical protein